MYVTFSPLKLLIVDKYTAFTRQVVQYSLNGIKYTFKIISPFNHGSSKMERQIQTVGNIITTHLTGKDLDGLI